MSNAGFMKYLKQLADEYGDGAEGDTMRKAHDTIADLEQQLNEANARVEALEFALTPSVETKAAYWGERTNNWTLIKGVMADIKALAAARGE